MKTNLDKMFKANKEFESEGVWFNISDDVGFLLKRFGGENSPQVKEAIARYSKPYAYQIAKGTLEFSKEREILVKVFVEAALLDWKGISIDDEENIPYSKETAIKFLIALPDLFETLYEHAKDSTNYREDLGNS